MQSFHNHLTDWKRPPVRGSKASDLTWSRGRRRWGSLTKAGRRSLLWAEEEWDGQRQENRQTVGRAAGRSQPSLCEDILRPGWEQRLTSTASLHLSGWPVFLLLPSSFKMQIYAAVSLKPNIQSGHQPAAPGLNSQLRAPQQSNLQSYRDIRLASLMPPWVDKVKEKQHNFHVTAKTGSWGNKVPLTCLK